MSSRKRRTAKRGLPSLVLRHKLISVILFFFVLIPTFVSLFHYFKPVPNGISAQGSVHETSGFQFLYDLTYETEEGTVEHEQEIFDYVFNMIEEAEEFVLLDMFLFNDDYDHTNPELDFPALSTDLAQALIQKKQDDPNIPIIFITDPINTFYGSYIPEAIEQMTDAGIDVIFTDLKPLRDSNPVYSGFSRTYLSWLGTSNAAYLPNIFRSTGPEVNAQSYVNLLHFKANHRKVIMNEQEGLITSANPHDASSYHSNVAYVLEGAFLNDLLDSEKAVAEMSGFDMSVFDTFSVNTDYEDSDESYAVQLLTERQIKNTILDYIEQADSSDAIKIGMFYLSDRDIIEALYHAEDRGVTIQMILDINQDAFGNEKIGIPNRPVANELTQGDSTIAVRWYHTHGEQYHAKFFLYETPEDVTMIGGSTNFTRRNMDDYNLETNVRITGQKGQPETDNMLAYFDRIWENEDGTYTVDYNTHAESTQWKNWLYRFQEWSGMSTF